MLLKKTHTLPEGWEPQRDRYGTLLNEPPVASLTIRHTGTHAAQTFRRELIDRLMREGLCTLVKGRLVLQTTPEALVYTIQRLPGEYVCCHCDTVIPGGDRRGAAQHAHVADQHAGAASPDPSNPAGYRLVMGYECVLDDAQHTRWQRPDGATVSHSRHGEQ